MAQLVVTTDLVEVHLRIDPGAAVVLSWVGAPGSEPQHPERAQQPLVEAMTPLLGNVNESNSTRWSGTALAAVLHYTSHELRTTPTGRTAEVVQTDPESGLVATTTLALASGSATVHAVTTVSLPEEADPLPLWGITTLALGGWLRNRQDLWIGVLRDLLITA